MRFADSPFSNPFASSERMPEPESTASTQSYGGTQAMPTAPVQSQPLAPVAAAPVAPVASSGTGSFTPGSGTTITVGQNDNLSMISQRYGVPSSAILAASGYKSASQVVPGSRVVIPVYNAQSGGGTKVASLAPVAVPAPQATPRPGTTSYRLVDGSKPVSSAPVAVQQSQTIKAPTPRTTVAATSPAPLPAPQKIQVASASTEPLVSPARPLAQQAAPAVPVLQPIPVKPAAEPAKAETKASEPVQVAHAGTTATDAAPAPAVSDEFRWPARGRVIAGFGANGGNEGINIALPEGTPVKASESGTVTYAGNEVKGYGNLVLIRHENGYVSAYAHNGSLNVKRGETVKRGQVIATSGQTGNVTSPQLHFELRKGSTPVDPVPRLGG
jgi:murein DD-endopeptidase MepM/ murein hydrolase activator NlpD